MLTNRTIDRIVASLKNPNSTFVGEIIEVSLSLDQKDCEKLIKHLNQLKTLNKLFSKKTILNLSKSFIYPNNYDHIKNSFYTIFEQEDAVVLMKFLDYLKLSKGLKCQ